MKRKQRCTGKPAPPDRFDHPSQRRPVDSHREWAAVSLPVLKVSSSVRGRPGPFDPVYTLEEDGVLVGTWRHSDAPWLREWLHTRLPQLHAAWHVARAQLEIITRLVDQLPDAIAARKSTAATERAKAVSYHLILSRFEAV
jgi:hypothetical protein